MTDERGLLVCLPIAGEPGEESIEAACSKCGALVWRSVGSLAHADLDPVCPRCVPREAKPGIRPRELLAFADAQGMTFEQAIEWATARGIEVEP